MLDTNNYAPWACATSIEARDAKVRAPKQMWFQVRLPLRRTASPGETRGARVKGRPERPGRRCTAARSSRTGKIQWVGTTRDPGGERGGASRRAGVVAGGVRERLVGSRGPAASSLEAGGEMGLAALHADREETAARARTADATDRFRPTRLILDAGHRLANGAGRRPVSAVAGTGVAVGNGGGRRSRAAGRGDYARSRAAPASRSFGLRRRPVHAARGRPGRATDPAQGWFYPDSADVPPRRVQSDR